MLTGTEIMDAALRRLGRRATAPRRKVARHIAGLDGTFRAESLITDLPGIGRATVYRTLKLLTDAGVLCKTAMPDGSPRYSFDSAWHHHHLICSTCESIDEFHDTALERFLGEISKAMPGRVVGHRLDLFVTCTDCLSDDNAEPKTPAHPNEG